MPQKEWTCWQGESKQAKSRSFLLLDPSIGLQQKTWSRLNVCLPTLRSKSKNCAFLPQRFRLEVDSPSSSQEGKKKSLTELCPPPLDCSSFQVGKLTTSESHHWDHPTALCCGCPSVCGRQAGLADTLSWPWIWTHTPSLDPWGFQEWATTLSLSLV